MNTAKKYSVNIGIFAFACMTLLLASGCGYKSGFLIPTDVDSVHVEMVSNKTFWRDATKTQNLDQATALATPRPAVAMDVELTTRIKNQILTRTPLKIASKAKADSVLTATITRVGLNVLLHDAKDDILAERVEISVDFVWTEKATGRILAQKTKVSRPTDFVVERNENFTTAARTSLDYVAEAIVEGMQEGF